ncbi:pentapeptide repeat protein [Parafrankia sp. EAN1pec]|uniref:pentapeptide repeat-containing protein n=1 Tax=Parafrankia sp. (strain EAN1pec) TaxID=298653 RepID=UPI00005449D0|nr:pentapeptide repeat protein [Frankia sp. EAN1pec]
MVDNGEARRRAGRRGLWIVAGIAAVGAVCAVVGIWHLPDRMYPPGTDGGAEARAALQGGLLTAAAALTAVAGGLIALDETRRANAEVRQANANTHVRELYTAAIGLLSSDAIDSRLGGIYALERIAWDSPADQSTVVEVLSAFVREHARPLTDAPAGLPAEIRGRGGGGLRSRRRRGHAAGRRSEVRHRLPPWDRFIQIGPWSNEAPPPTDVQAALTVLGRLPDLGGFRADLTGANLTGAELEGANLFPARLTRATFTGSHLGRVNLKYAQLYLTNFTDATINSINFTRAQIQNTNFTGTLMMGADFSEALISDADFTDAFLTATVLTDAIISANFTRAFIVEVDFSGLNIGGINLTDARLQAVNFSGAKGLTQEQVDSAQGDGRTRLPAGLVRPASWGPEEPPVGGG